MCLIALCFLYIAVVVWTNFSSLNDYCIADVIMLSICGFCIVYCIVLQFSCLWIEVCISLNFFMF